LQLELERGIVLAVGENGAGKTNLLEALHVGTQGFSPRTRNDAQLVRFGAEAGRIELGGHRGGTKLEVELTLRPGEAKRAQLNGGNLRAAEQLRAEIATLVFTPDRLVVVKGGPAARRAYFDRVLGRLFPARSGVPADYGAAVAQRNAALRRVMVGVSSSDAVSPWTQRVAELGEALVAARLEAINLLAAPFGERAAELGLAGAELLYEAEPPSAEALVSRLQEDLDRGVTGLGPHLDDIGIVAGGRDLRRFGSQGEQRLAVLSLLLAEAELLTQRGPAPPLLLLDDVLSELDEGRRRALAERLGASGQTLITATAAWALPVEPRQLVEVRPGSARSVSA
jgi:DNA replication and repair protein RecF